MQNEIIGVLGCKGAGKSTEVKRIYMSRTRVIVNDTLGEYGGYVCDAPDPRRKAIDYIAANKVRFRIAFRPEKLEADFDWVCRLAKACGAGTTLIVEEIDFFCQPNFAEPGLDKLIRYGRNDGINLIYTGKRFADISRRLTSQTDRFLLFRISEPGDLDGIRKRFGDEVAEKVRSLPDFEHLEIDVRTAGRPESIPEPEPVAERTA